MRSDNCSRNTRRVGCGWRVVRERTKLSKDRLLHLFLILKRILVAGGSQVGNLLMQIAGAVRKMSEVRTCTYTTTAPIIDAHVTVARNAKLKQSLEKLQGRGCKPVDVEGLGALIKDVLENHRELVYTSVKEVRNEDQSAAQKLVGTLFHLLIHVPVVHAN